MEKQWYAVYTKPRWEKKVAESLTRHKIEAYCPINRVMRQWSDRKKIIEEPLFTSYVFTRVAVQEMSAVRQIDGIVNFVHWLGRPARIRPDEIGDIKIFLSTHQNVTLERIPVNPRDNIRIVNGPLSEREGQVIAVSPKIVRVVIQTLGYALTAEVSRNDIKLIQSTHAGPAYA